MVKHESSSFILTDKINMELKTTYNGLKKHPSK